MNYKIMHHNEIIDKYKSPIITWGVSEVLKKHYKDFYNIAYILESNQNLINTFLNTSKIVKNEDIYNFEHPIILMGNHVLEQLTILDTYGIKNEIIVDESLTKDILFLKDNSAYFSKTNDMKYKHELFKNAVKMVEIEPHSYCNRVCWFCPNSYIDRKSTVHYMDNNLINKLFDDLETINYSRIISFTRYAEPFGNDIFYDVLKLANEKLPNATLHANTNGDFLNNNTLNRAYEAGLRSLNIQLYLQKDEKLTLDIVEKLATRILKRTNHISIELSKHLEDWIEYKCVYKDMQMRMYARDFSKNGTSRCEIKINVYDEIRTKPCLLPFTDIYIDYNGNVIPCCNIRSDELSQSNYIISNLSSYETIFDLYFSDKFISWRKKLFNFSPKKFEPCAKCYF